MPRTPAPWSRSPRCSGPPPPPRPATDPGLRRVTQAPPRTLAPGVQAGAGRVIPDIPRTVTALPAPYASAMADAVHPRAPGWYRRFLVLALLGVVAAPAAAGALWFTQHPTAPPVAQAPAPPAATPSGSKGGTAGTSVEGAAGPKSAEPDASALDDLLGRRSAAVAARDARARAATRDGAGPGVRRRHGPVFDRLLALRPASWRYQAGPPDAGLGQDRRDALGAPAFLAHVVLTY